MNKAHTIHGNGADLTLEHLRDMLSQPHQLMLSPACEARIAHCRTYLERKLNDTDELFYGINTGFGALCHIQISKRQTHQLQLNLVRSHACGMGDEVPADIVRLMLLLKIQNLALGYSGVRLSLVQRLVDFYNADILPVVYQLGSLGASGDLAPLAHLSLPVLGEGAVDFAGQRMTAAEALAQAGLAPMSLEAKEGLALLNGTQFSTAYAVWCLLRAEHLWSVANCCAALSLDAFDARLSPFDAHLHRIRPHAGQVRTAADIRHLLAGSDLAVQNKTQVQDPYAFRCVPQVHGASYDALQYVRQVLHTEINAVTDNPNIFPHEDLILSGGNFHAQPIALAMDFLAIAVAELGSISERRTFQLISGQRGLPAFLTPQPGLNSGLMIPQYTAAAIASQNKQLCTPASIDSIVSSNGQEDHVSMAANAGTKGRRVVENVGRLLAIEWMTAAQALSFRHPLRSSPILEALVSEYRERVPPLEDDRILSTDLHETLGFLLAMDTSALHASA